MKKIISMVLMITILSVFSGCVKTAPSQEFEEQICVANISTEKLTITSQTGTYTFFARSVSDDQVSDYDFSDQFSEMLDTGMVCHQDPVNLTIRFEDRTPSQIVWSQLYYRPGTNAFPKTSIAMNTTIEHAGGDVVLNLGNNISVLDSSVKANQIYRIVRIICLFDEQNYEYYAIFDGWI